MYSNSMKVRFAPAPTGKIHLGSLRTLLFLYYKYPEAEIMLRIDDSARKPQHFTYLKNIFKTIRIFNLHVRIASVHTQSKRLTLYKNYFERIAPHLYLDDDLYRVYPVDTVFTDMYKGKLTRKGEDIFPFAIRKGDSYRFYYNFMSVVDDIEECITHIIRGEDHISNTFGQQILFNLFNYPIEFGHIPLLLDEEGHKLSKRHGAVDVMRWLRRGIQKDTIIISLLWPSATKEDVGNFIKRGYLKITKPSYLRIRAEVWFRNNQYVMSQMSAYKILKHILLFMPTCLGRCVDIVQGGYYKILLMYLKVMGHRLRNLLIDIRGFLSLLKSLYKNRHINIYNLSMANTAEMRLFLSGRANNPSVIELLKFYKYQWRFQRRD